jgi:hypothetical protein
LTQNPRTELKGDPRAVAGVILEGEDHDECVELSLPLEKSTSMQDLKEYPEPTFDSRRSHFQ